MDVLFLLSPCRFYSGINLSVQHKTVCENLFLKSCPYWDDRIVLHETEKNLGSGGIVCYGDSYLDFILCYTKRFRLIAVLHEVAEALRPQTGKGCGCYCYKIGQGKNSRSVGPVTGLFFGLYVRLFLSFFRFCQTLKQYVLHCAGQKI